MSIVPCPFCGSGSEVADSRPRQDGTVRRRRHCMSCDHRWTTVEMAAEQIERLEARNTELEAFVALVVDAATRPQIVPPVSVPNGGITRLPEDAA